MQETYQKKQLGKLSILIISNFQKMVLRNDLTIQTISIIE